MWSVGDFEKPWHRRKPVVPDVPVEWLKSCLPHTYIGVNWFGPWECVTRHTRGGCPNSKIYIGSHVFLFVVSWSTYREHIELIERMDPTSFTPHSIVLSSSEERWKNSTPKGETNSYPESLQSTWANFNQTWFETWMKAWRGSRFNQMKGYTLSQG